ncbi:MAG: diacylglycerol/polyprenol kinase family protein [Candidatus Hydrothermarchaeota archaeon]
MKDLDLKQEIIRKAVHLTSVIIVLLYYMLDKNITLFLLTVVLIILIEIEFVRIEWGKKIPFFWRFFREKERESLGGEVFLLIGAIIAISVFDKEIASAAILMTTFGDMSAAIFGKAFGKKKVPKLESKYVEGCLAELFIDIGIGYFFLQNLVVSLIMAVTATTVETIVTKLDDNLLIPLFAGFNGQLALILF